MQKETAVAAAMCSPEITRKQDPTINKINKIK